MSSNLTASAISMIAIVLSARLAFALAGSEDTAPAGLQTHVRFSDPSPLARTEERLHRLFSPLQALRAEQAIAKSGQPVNDQSIDPAQEEFAVYVPVDKPQGGYALLVFIPPWDDATVPAQWTGPLHRHGTIFVSAANSGNDASVLDRREPLALLAAHNVMQHYAVDPARVYVGGFSGGSRVAMRLALAYPDLFRGALLNAGSDPIGTAQIPLPPASLMRQFQERTHLVYLTGNEDGARIAMDVQSRKSMQDWCVFDIATLSVAWSGHDVLGTAAFNRGLDALDRHEQPAPARLASCRRQHEDEMGRQLAQVDNLRSNGKLDDAGKLLEAIDARYGGLAAPRSVELARDILPKIR